MRITLNSLSFGRFDEGSSGACDDVKSSSELLSLSDEDDDDDISVELPRPDAIKSVSFTDEFSFFGQLILFGAVCSYYLPLLEDIDTRPLLERFALLISTLISRSPHYAACVQYMDRIPSFDIIKGTQCC